MRQLWSESLKQRVRPSLFRALYPRKQSFECPICGYYGPFKDKHVSRVPNVRRADSKCMGCGATERHRMISMVLDEILDEQCATQRLLHIAPEFCLQPRLKQAFGVYHTADLFRTDVDFNEDIQAMSFPDGSYDCVFVSRVLMIPEDLEACIREMRRVLAKGGIAVIAETYTRDTTLEFEDRSGERIREIGLDALDLYRRYFDRVDLFQSGHYDRKYQLHNAMLIDGQPADDYPEAVRVPGVGFQDVVAICHA